MNIVDVNIYLGLEVDVWQYNIVIEMLQELGIDKINLLINNFEKINVFDDVEIDVIVCVLFIIKL